MLDKDESIILSGHKRDCSVSSKQGTISAAASELDMAQKREEPQPIDKIVAWARALDDVRCVVLTSSRTNPDVEVDAFSDIDIILVVKDILPYLDDEAWLREFGEVLVLYRDPVRREYGCERFCRVTQYEDGTKIDFTVWPVDMLPAITRLPVLPNYLDIGYKVLLDKDNLASGLKLPSHKAYIPVKPTEVEYLEFVEHFLSNAPYVAKHLSRGDLISMKYILDHVMKFEKLRILLEWKMEIDRGWSVKPGADGKGLGRYVSRDVWAWLERTYVGTGTDENWEALFETVALFRKVAAEVADSPGYRYPSALHDRVVRYLTRVRDTAEQGDANPGTMHSDEKARRNDDRADRLF